MSKKPRERIRNCPAYGQECFKCKRKNHFATSKICKGKRKEQNVNEYFHIGRETIHNVRANLKLNGKPIKFMLDSGATVNVIPATFIKDNRMERFLKKKKIKKKERNLIFQFSEEKSLELKELRG